MKLRTLTLASTLALAACGSDPVSYSEPVTINLSAKSGDVANATVTDDKNINTEQGNPYGAFVANAQAKLGGAQPGHLEVDHGQLLLGANSTGVTTLDEIFAGQVDILFVMNDTNVSAPVASRTIAAGAGAGPLALDIGFDDGTLAAADYQRLLGGSFKLAIRGPAAAMFQSKGADADLQVTLTFTAFE
jgi:hypothetical protein